MIQSAIKFFRNKFHGFLPDLDNSFFINPVNKTEVRKIILSLNLLKAVGPNSIPSTILKLLSKNISNQLSELFNLPLSLVVFPLILKSSKFISIFKKESELKYSSCRPIFLPSNIDKILERVMYNHLYEFLEYKNFIWSAISFLTKTLNFSCIDPPYR